MTEEELIREINILSKKSKAEGLTEEEKKIQQDLRAEYIRRITGSLRGHLDNIKKK